MRVRGHNLFTITIVAASILFLLPAVAQPAVADSFAGLNLFGFPADGSTLAGLSDASSGGNVLSASSASFSPPNQFTGYFGPGFDGMQLGIGFTYPVASHDASTTAFARSVAFESFFGDDAIAFPDLGAGLNGTGSSFPTISSTNGNVRYMESVQLQLSTVSDTMPMPMPVAGFSYPSNFFSSFFN